MNLGFGMVFGADTRGFDRGIASIESSLSKLNGSINAWTGTASASFNRLFGNITRGAGAVIGQAAEVETSEVMLKFAFRDMSKEASASIESQIQDTGLLTMQTTNEIRDLTVDMKRMSNVNIFDPSVPKLMYKANGEMHEMLNAAVLMGDVASGLQFGTRSARLGLMGLLTDNFSSAKKHLDPIASKMDEYKKAVAGITNQQEKFAAIAPLLARDFGGMSDMQRDTWKYMASQMTDIRQKLATTFARPFMAEIMKPLQALQAYFVGSPNGILLQANINKLDGIANAFKAIGHYAAQAASYVGLAAKRLGEFTIQHPIIIKIAAAILTVLTAVTGLGAGLGGIKIAVQALAFSFSGLLSAALPLMVVGGMLLGLGYAFAKMAVGGSSVTETLTRLGLAARAVYEGLSNMDGSMTHLSQKTMRKLKNAGIEGFVVSVLKFGYRIKTMFIGIYKGFTGMGDTIMLSFSFLADSINHLFGTIGKQMGLTTTTAGDKWENAGQMIGKGLAMIIIGFNLALSAIVKLADWSIVILGYVWDAIVAIRSALNDVADAGKTAFDVLSDIADISSGGIMGGLLGMGGDVVGGLAGAGGPIADMAQHKDDREMGNVFQQRSMDGPSKMPKAYSAADAKSPQDVYMIRLIRDALRGTFDGMAVNIDGAKVGEMSSKHADNDTDRGGGISRGLGRR